MEENGAQKKTEVKDQLFRSKSLQRISSPEELNDYVRVANPGVWMALGAIVLLLAGFLLWAAFGSVNTTVKAVLSTENNQTKCFVSETDAERISEGMTVVSEGREYTIAQTEVDYFKADNVLTDYEKHALDLDEGEWVCLVELDGTAENGVHTATIITESVNPIKFILN